MNETGKRQKIDIMKGLAILLMVYGHTYGRFYQWVYLFHMPVFFMISGYCWNSKHADSPGEVRKYLAERVKRLIVPYWIANLCFLVLETAEHFEGGRMFLRRAAQVILFRYIPQLGGPTWFLNTLFLLCAGHCLLSFLIKADDGAAVKGILCLFTAAILLAWGICAGVLSGSDVNAGNGMIPLRFLRLPACHACYLLGMIARRVEGRCCRCGEVQTGSDEGADVFSADFKGRLRGSLLLWIPAFAVLCFMNHFGEVELYRCEITNPVFLLISSLAGWILLSCSAEWLAAFTTVPGKLMTKLGQHTMPVVFLHCLAFRLVSLIYVLAEGMPGANALSYPVIFTVPEWVKMIYTIVGTAVPVTIVSVPALRDRQIRL